MSTLNVNKGVTTYVGLLLLLGLGHLVTGGRGTLDGLGSLAVGFRVSELAGYGLTTTPAWLAFEPPLLSSFLLICRLSDLDDQLAAIELLLVEELNSLLYGFRTVQGYKPIARRACPAENDLGGESRVATSVGRMPADAQCQYVHIVLNGREKRLQPFIRGGIRKIADKDL